MDMLRDGRVGTSEKWDCLSFDLAFIFMIPGFLEEDDAIESHYIKYLWIYTDELRSAWDFTTKISSIFSSSDEYSWKKSIDLLEKVVRQGEHTGYKVPCLLIAAKDDLTPFPRALLDSVKVMRF